MRILDQFNIKEKISKEKLITSIKESNGRTIISEIFVTKSPLLGDISNLELSKAFGADLLLLNNIDVNNLKIPGIVKKIQSVRDIKNLVSCPIGIDLYVKHKAGAWPTDEILATDDNLLKAIELGFDFVNIVADPVQGVNNDYLINFIMKIPKDIKDKLVVISGRMNMAGINENASKVFSKSFVNNMASVGVDIFIFPTPGTAQGLTPSIAEELTLACSENKILSMSGIGSSQEGADEDTIKKLAFTARLAGVDIHHLGDAGYIGGMATPENIMTYSIAIKGKRHTYRKISASINR